MEACSEAHGRLDHGHVGTVRSEALGRKLQAREVAAVVPTAVVVLKRDADEVATLAPRAPG